MNGQRILAKNLNTLYRRRNIFASQTDENIDAINCCWLVLWRNKHACILSVEGGRGAIFKKDS